MKIFESEYGDSPNNFDIYKNDDVLIVNLTYPPYKDSDNKYGKCQHVEINQESVRASDGIRVHYDYDRDGFVIEQPIPAEDIINKKWVEVAFVASWGQDAE